jgi:lipoyl(octanoyl) transferase 2
MSILHLPLPSLSSYVATHALQTHLVRHLLSLKSLRRPLPPPLILTMELLPTYTFGRRQQIAPQDHGVLSNMATVIKSQRGGLTTYHGPGQVVGYPILDLKLQKLVLRSSMKLMVVSAMLCACTGKLGYTIMQGIRS